MDETNQLNKISMDQASGLKFTEEVNFIDIPDPYGWVWPTVISLMALLIMTVGYFWWLKVLKARTKNDQVYISAYQKAMLRLQKAMSLESAPRAFVSEVSNTIRSYLEEQFSISAPEQTTEEFLKFIKDDKTLHPKHKVVLDEFLKTADLVKFAKLEPGKTELLKLFDTAKNFVDQTGISEEKTTLDSEKTEVTEGGTR